jgi:hypothetical protein
MAIDGNQATLTALVVVSCARADMTTRGEALRPNAGGIIASALTSASNAAGADAQIFDPANP